MNARTINTPRMTPWLVALLLLAPLAAPAQAPVDAEGNAIGTYDPSPTGNEDIPLLTSLELEELVGPVALYPDDLLAVVLPASAYPLQLVAAQRFLEDLEQDPSLEPDPDWDDSVVALLNYPEVLDLLNEDIDWTWRLGEAVVAQQDDVIAAVAAFRERAYAAGNLKSDDYQAVSRDEGTIEIVPVSDDVIYVPYYEPARVIVHQPRPVYYYYPRAYPVYYYPYPSSYEFDRGFFWGVTTAFTIGWMSDSLHVYHHSYHGHPYYGHHYWDHWWYRRPSITIYNTHYSHDTRITVNRFYSGDRWHARRDRHDYVDTPRVTRNRHITRTRSTEGLTSTARTDRPRVSRNTSTARRIDAERRRDDLRQSPASRPGREQSVQREIRRERETSRPSSEVRRRDHSQPATPPVTRRTERPAIRGERRDMSQPARPERPARRESSQTTRPSAAERRQPERVIRSERRESPPRETVERRQSAPRATQPRRQSPPRATSERRQVERRPTERATRPPPRQEPARPRVERRAPQRAEAPPPRRSSSENRSSSRKERSSSRDKPRERDNRR